MYIGMYNRTILIGAAILVVIVVGIILALKNR